MVLHFILIFYGYFLNVYLFVFGCAVFSEWGLSLVPV